MMKTNDERNELKKTTEDFIQSGKEYQMIFEHANVGIAVHKIILDENNNATDFTFVDINPAYEKMTGFKRKDIIGKRIKDVVPNIEDKWFDICKIAQDGKSFSFVDHSISLNKDFNISAYSAQKNFFTIMMFDITEQVVNRQKLEEAKDIAERYLELSGSIILALDNHGDITMINASGVDILGYKTKEELLGKNWFKTCLPPKEKESFPPKFKQLIDKQIDQSKYLESWVVTKSGQNRLISWHNTLIKDDEENIVGTLSSGIDITQRWEAEKKIQESETKYRNYIEHSPNAVFIVNKNGNYIQANPAAESITGYTVDEILKMNIADFSPDPQSLESAREGFQELQEKNKISIILSYKRKNGSIGWWTVDAVKLSDDRYMGFSTDITEEIEAKMLLEKSEETFRYAMEAAVDGIWDWDIQTNKVFYSPGWNNILGVKKLKPDLSTLEDHLHPDDREPVLNSIHAYINGSGENWEYDYRLKHQGGNWIWVKGKGKIVEYDNTGKPKRMVGTATNIDEKMRAEKQLEEQKILLDSIIDQSPFPTFICNETGIMIRVNNALLDTLNYKREQLVGIYNVLKDQNLIEQGVMPLVKKVFKNKHTVQFTQFWKKDLIGIDIGPGGKDLYNDVTLFPILNYNGDLEYVVCQWIEITDQVLANRALEESEEKYRFIVENQNDLIVTINTQHHITFANPNYCRIFGVNEKDILNHSFIPLIHKDDVESVKASLESVKKPPHTSYHEERAKTADGWRWFGWSLKANLDEKGNITRIVAVGRDITDRKNIEFQIEQLSRFPSENPNPVLRISRDGSILYSNHASNDVLTEIANRDKKTVISKWQTSVIQVLSSDTPIQKEIDVGPMTYTVNIVPVKKHDYVNLYLNDITEVKKAEKEKFASESRFKELVNTINSGVAVYKVINDGASGSDYIIQDFNKTALELEDRKDAIGKSLKDIRPNIDDYGLIDIFREVWKTGKPAYYPAKLYKDENYTNYYENRVFRLPSGEIVAVYDDVTEKTLATLRLKQSEERFELAMNASKDGLYDWNLITNEIYYSPGYKAMLGYEYHELPNEFSVWETLTDPEDVKRSFAMQRKLVAGEIDRFEIEFKMKHKDGHWVNILSRAEVVRDESGKAVRMIGTHVDISEQKKTENDLIEAMNKAKESDRLKSAFLANMSHEIRTPMNGIIGFSSLLQEADLSSAKQQEYINIIQKSGTRMLNTINDLIDISRIESGQVKIKMSDVNINDQLKYLFRFFKPEADQKDIRLSFSAPMPDKNALINTDEEKLHAILSNYLKNAIKYTHNGDIDFGYSLKKNTIEFYVNDSGIGIPEDKLNAVFERFVQADLSLSKPYEGSGLGLAISKAYAELIGGRVRVESTVDKGSTFYLELPFVTQHKVKQHDESSSKHDHDQMNTQDLNILLVEDDEASILYMKILLKNKCRTLHIAGNGSDAIQTVKDHPEINLILMDVRMPDMDGFTATGKIRVFNPDVPIIAQTAYAMESDRIKALEAGCNGYISKPINEKDLFELIDKLHP